MSNLSRDIGRLIRHYRLEKGWTQQELAEQAELSLPYINFLENNKRSVSLETLLNILHVLEISPSDFFYPFSQNHNDDLSELIIRLQDSSDQDRYIALFLDILSLGK
ncbi:helix-turn-helix domain-containing protein [Streptococcus thoraltensis]